MSDKLIVAHGDIDGVTSAAILFGQLGIEPEDLNVVFTQPDLVDQVVIPDEVDQVYVVDIAINNRDPEMTADFVRRLGGKLVRWYDHHQGWEDYHGDDRFTTREGLSCASRIGLAHDIRVKDAVVADTREGELSPTGQLIERAIKSDMSNDQIRLWAVRLLMGDETCRNPLKGAERAYQMVENETKWLAGYGQVKENVWFLDVPGTYYKTYGSDGSFHTYDLTQLLLAGQKLAEFAVVETIDHKTDEELVTVATKTKINLVELFELKSGAPFRVTLPALRLAEVIEKLREVV